MYGGGRRQGDGNGISGRRRSAVWRSRFHPNTDDEEVLAAVNGGSAAPPRAAPLEAIYRIERCRPSAAAMHLAQIRSDALAQQIRAAETRKNFDLRLRKLKFEEGGRAIAQRLLCARPSSAFSPG